MIVEWLVEADHAHFSHPATIYSSLTYPVPPKTAVMGMLAALAGRSGYTELNRMRYAVRIEKLEGKRRFSFNGIKEALRELDPKKTPGFHKGRKQFYRELLVGVRYRLFCDLRQVDERMREEIASAMRAHKAYYPLYLGINFCLADYRLCAIHERSTTQQNDEAPVDTMVPLDTDFILEEGKRYTDVRMPTTVDEKRNFGGFRDYLIELEGKPILCRNVETQKVGEYSVIWS